MDSVFPTVTSTHIARDAFYSLKSSKPVAVGGFRLVFAHPVNPRFLIKVIRPDRIEQEQQRGALSKALRRYGHLIQFQREVSEQIAARAADEVLPPYVQQIVRIVETDMGMGLVSKAVLGPDGQMAMNLADRLRAEGMTAEVHDALGKFEEQILASNVAIGDMHPGNLVYGTQNDGQLGITLVDGIGIKTLIPLYGISQVLNRRHKLKRLAVMWRQINRILVNTSAAR